jgi:dynein heavy chain
MRAVKSILNACGNNRRNPAMETWPEENICLKALNDVNLPKFTSNDIPLYQGITSDLFPGAELKSQDYSALTDQMKLYCEEVNLQPKPIFLQKCIELYETHIVRHGLMVVGDPYAGKSCVMKTLAEAISGASEENPEMYQKVDEHYVNPKSIT